MMEMEKYNVQELRNLLCNPKDFQLETWTPAPLRKAFDISPEEFLDYAEKDLSSNYPHSKVNALSNIKRAIDCQIDTLLFAFGLYETSRRKNWNFPEKINVLKESGIILPRILEKINKKRNLLEHEYKSPEVEEVEDALDVAMLFIVYTQKFTHGFINEIGIYGNECGSFTMSINKERESILITTDELKEDELVKNEKNIIAVSSEEYKDYLKLFIRFCALKDYNDDSEA